MDRMVRKQVYIAPDQEEFLKRRARELGVTEAELIRRGIDQLGRVALTLPLDQRAWAEARAFIEEHRRLAVAQTGRGWTREELYAERGVLTEDAEHGRVLEGVRYLNPFAPDFAPSMLLPRPGSQAD